MHPHSVALIHMWQYAEIQYIDLSSLEDRLWAAGPRGFPSRQPLPHTDPFTRKSGKSVRKGSCWSKHRFGLLNSVVVACCARSTRKSIPG
jgi:hypothetical protein